MTTVRDFMSTELTILSPRDDVLRAMQTLIEGGISGAPVVDEQAFGHRRHRARRLTLDALALRRLRAFVASGLGRVGLRGLLNGDARERSRLSLGGREHHKSGGEEGSDEPIGSQHGRHAERFR